MSEHQAIGDSECDVNWECMDVRWKQGATQSGSTVELARARCHCTARTLQCKAMLGQGLVCGTQLEQVPAFLASCSSLPRQPSVTDGDKQLSSPAELHV